MNNLDDDKIKKIDLSDLSDQDQKEKDYCQKLMANFIDVNGKIMVLELKAELGFNMKYQRLSSDQESNLEGLLEKVGDLNRRGNFTPLLEIIVNAFIAAKGDSYSNWSHSLCHTFEKYGRYGSKEPSVLNSEYNRGLNKKLVDDCVRRAIYAGELGCIGRIIEPIMKYNIRHINLDEQDGGNFTFRPESLLAPAFLALYSYNNDQPEEILIAKNPREMLVMIIKNDLENSRVKKYWNGSRISFPIADLVKILEKLQPELSQQEIEQYLALKLKKKKDETVSLNELKAELKVAEAASELIKGAFVDVDGTLLIEGKIDDGHLKLLQKMKEKGLKVTIITGGNPEVTTMKLKELNVPEELLPVQSKLAYRGKVLEILFDDTVPEVQGFRALNYISSFYYLNEEKLESLTAQRGDIKEQIMDIMDEE